MAQLTEDFCKRVQAGFRPRSKAAFLNKFRLYLAFVSFLKIRNLDSVHTVSLFVEFLAQQDLCAQTLTNYLSVLRHFFCYLQPGGGVTGTQINQNGCTGSGLQCSITLQNQRRLLSAATKSVDSSSQFPTGSTCPQGYNVTGILWVLPAVLSGSSFKSGLLCRSVPNAWGHNLGASWCTHSDKSVKKV